MKLSFFETVIHIWPFRRKKAIYKHRLPDEVSYIVSEVVSRWKVYAVLGQGTKENEKFFKSLK
jgi:hypothetical protein